MHHRGQYYIGGILIFIGALFLIARILNISAWGILWPLALVGLGLWLLIRHRHIEPDTTIRHKLFGDIRRRGDWQVTHEELRIFIGDIDLDMTQAQIPQGETTIRLFGFIGDVDVFIPKSVGVTVSSSALITDGKLLGKREEKFLSSIHATSDNYKTAKKKIRLETTYFIHDVTVKHV